jgi:hypothetical protein
MANATKSSATRPFIDQSMDQALEKAESQLTDEGKLWTEELELEAQRQVAGLPHESANTRYQKIIQLIGGMAKLVSCMSAEACKEDHRTFMEATAKVSELAIVTDAFLIEWEALLREQEPMPRSGLFHRLGGLIFERTDASEHRRALER